MAMKYPSHMVQMDDQKFHAKSPSTDVPEHTNNWSDFEVLEGPPATYMLPSYVLRSVEFSTVEYGEVSDVRERLKILGNKVVEFSSPYMGAFKARVSYSLSWEDGVPDTTYVSFKVQEIVD